MFHLLGNMRAADPQFEAARAWRIVVSPNVLHVVGEGQLDEWAKREHFLVKNVHQLVGLTASPNGGPLTSVQSTADKQMHAVLLENVKWIKKDGDGEYIPIVPHASTAPSISSFLAFLTLCSVEAERSSLLGPPVSTSISPIMDG